MVSAVAGWNHLAAAAPGRSERNAAARQPAREELFAGSARPWRDALEIDPSNAAAWRMAADFLEQGDDSDAVDVRRQIVLSQPDSLDNRLALVHTALRHGDLAGAQRVLVDLPALAVRTRDVTLAEAAVAFATNHIDVADGLVNAALAESPDPAAIRFEQTKLRLRLGGRAEIPAARAELQQLAQARPDWRAVRRELLADAWRQGAAEQALVLATDLAGAADASFADQLRRADAAMFFRRETFADSAAALARQAARTPAAAAAFSQWLIARGRADSADAWIDTLPVELARTPEIRHAHADCLAALGDWDRALPLIAGGAWGEIGSDIVRRILAEREIGPRRVDHAAWEKLIAAAVRDPRLLRAVHRLAVAWKREPQRIALLAAATRADAKPAWAFQALADEFYQQRNTPRLLELYAAWHDAEPANAAVAGNLILLRLLTARRPSAELRATIEELSQQHPRDPLIETVRALSLWQQGRATEAVAVTEHLPSIARRLMPRAFYHGLFVAAAGGQVHEAEKYLLLSEPARLLPEEERLVRTARGLLSRVAASE